LIEPDNERQEKLLETVKFLYRLVAFGLVFQVVTALLPATPELQGLYAELISRLLDPVGSTTHTGIQIGYNGVDYIISQDCLGWKSWFALSGLMASSFNKAPRWRLIGIAGGLAAVAALNTVRVISTVVLADAGLGFNILHTVTWRWGMTLSVLLLWITWYRKDNLLS
jgi:exosortase/archaeosortase family protein